MREFAVEIYQRQSAFISGSIFAPFAFFRGK